MRRAPRTGFAWEANPGEPFIHIEWDYRRGMAPTARAIAVGRLAAVAAVTLTFAAVLQAIGGRA